MSQQAAIVINDGLATPVAHTFAPAGVIALPDGKTKATWVDRSVTQVVGRYTIHEWHSPANVNGIEKFRYVITRPTMQTLSNGSVSGIEPVPGKLLDTIFDGEFRVSVNAGLDETNDIVAFVKNLFALTYIKDAVNNRDAAYG